MSDDSPKPGGNTGRANLKPAWKPGESGNPNGRPKSAKWRRKNQRAASLLLQSILERRDDPDVPVEDLRKAMVDAASFAGFLTVKDLIAALTSANVTDDQRNKMLEGLSEKESESE